jgi:hypothetical protein
MAGRSRLGDNNSSSHTQGPPEPTQLGIGLAHRRARAQGEMILRSENPPVLGRSRSAVIEYTRRRCVSSTEWVIWDGCGKHRTGRWPSVGGFRDLSQDVDPSQLALSFAQSYDHYVAYRIYIQVLAALTDCYPSVLGQPPFVSVVDEG